MKSLILASIICISLFQQEEQISTIATIKIPAKSVKLSKVDLLTYSNKNFKYAALIKNAKNIYKSDDILIAFEDKNLTQQKSMSLSEMKERMLSEGEEMQVRGGSVDIIKIKNIDYLIFKQNSNNDYSYTFYSEARNKKYLEGSVIFKKIDKERAEKIFFDFIKNVSYK